MSSIFPPRSTSQNNIDWLQIVISAYCWLFLFPCQRNEVNRWSIEPSWILLFIKTPSAHVNFILSVREKYYKHVTHLDTNDSSFSCLLKIKYSPLEGLKWDVSSSSLASGVHTYASQGEGAALCILSNGFYHVCPNTGSYYLCGSLIACHTQSWVRINRIYTGSFITNVI